MTLVSCVMKISWYFSSKKNTWYSACENISWYSLRVCRNLALVICAVETHCSVLSSLMSWFFCGCTQWNTLLCPLLADVLVLFVGACSELKLIWQKSVKKLATNKMLSAGNKVWLCITEHVPNCIIAVALRILKVERLAPTVDQSHAVSIRWLAGTNIMRC